jgi:hypothetical protein
MCGSPNPRMFLEFLILMLVLARFLFIFSANEMGYINRHRHKYKGMYTYNSTLKI